MKNLDYFEGLRKPHDPKQELPVQDVPLYINRPLHSDEDIERALTQELAA